MVNHASNVFYPIIARGILVSIWSYKKLQFFLGFYNKSFKCLKMKFLVGIILLAVFVGELMAQKGELIIQKRIGI